MQKMKTGFFTKDKIFEILENTVSDIEQDINNWEIDEKKNKRGDIKYIDLKEKNEGGAHVSWRIKKQFEHRAEIWRFQVIEILKYKNNLGLNIEAYIQNFIKTVRDSDSQNVNQETEFLTNMMDRLYQEKKISAVKGERVSISTGSMIKLEDLITQRHYGYLKKMDNFLRDGEAYKRYLPKNLTEWNWNWSGDVIALISHLEDDRQLLLYEEKTADGIENRLEQATMIWNRRSKLYDPVDVPQSNEGRSTLKNMLFGRQNSRNYDIIAQIDKVDSLKVLVVTGHEDKIGTYMKKFGFWKEDLYSSDTYLHIDPDDFQTGADQYICDRKDLMLLYSLLYRDELIESYFFSDKSDEEKSRLKKEFPFLELVMEVSNTVLRCYKDWEKIPLYTSWNLYGAGITGTIYPDDVMFFEEKGKRGR